MVSLVAPEGSGVSRDLLQGLTSQATVLHEPLRLIHLGFLWLQFNRHNSGLISRIFLHGYG